MYLVESLLASHLLCYKSDVTNVAQQGTARGTLALGNRGESIQFCCTLEYKRQSNTHGVQKGTVIQILLIGITISHKILKSYKHHRIVFGLIDPTQCLFCGFYCMTLYIFSSAPQAKIFVVLRCSFVISVFDYLQC